MKSSVSNEKTGPLPSPHICGKERNSQPFGEVKVQQPQGPSLHFLGRSPPHAAHTPPSTPRTPPPVSRPQDLNSQLGAPAAVYVQEQWRQTQSTIVRREVCLWYRGPCESKPFLVSRCLPVWLDRTGGGVNKTPWRWEPYHVRAVRSLKIHLIHIPHLIKENQGTERGEPLPSQHRSGLDVASRQKSGVSRHQPLC